MGHHQGREETKAGKVEFRVDKAGIVHCPVERFSYSAKPGGKRARIIVAVVKSQAGSGQGQVR